MAKTKRKVAKRKVKKASKFRCNLLCVKNLLAVLAVVIVVAFTLIFPPGGSPPITPFTPSSEGNNNSTQSGGTVNVAIQNYAYSPASVSISAGESIRWTNDDANRVHYVAILGIETSKALHKGDSWIHTFGTPGTYQFRDSDLPYMTGTVTVS